MIRRFARMFLQDTSFQQLTDAMARQDVKDAFLAAHTLKGSASTSASATSRPLQWP